MNRITKAPWLTLLAGIAACSGVDVDDSALSTGQNVSALRENNPWPSATDAGAPAPTTTTPAPPPPVDRSIKIASVPPTSLGLRAFTANGRIHPRGYATTYHIDYGDTDTYGSRTAERALPGKLAAHYDEGWNAGLAGWHGGANHADLRLLQETNASFARYTDPGHNGDDYGHFDGIGLIHLAQFVYTGWYDPGYVRSAVLGGGDPDFRDAEVSVRVRGTNWQAHQEEVTAWLQSDRDPTTQYTSNFRKSNWGHTGFSLTKHLVSGQWERVKYRLENDSNQWSYAGTMSDRPNYVYAPLNDVLQSVNTDFFHNILFVDIDRMPSGSIDFDDFQLTYRNHSVLFPSNGGTLVKVSPPSEAVAYLTDGWRFGEGHSWVSAQNPAQPFEFQYELANPVVLKSIQIHNDPQWPSKDVEVLVSTDGTNWSKIGAWTLPAQSNQGPNFNFHLERRVGEQNLPLPLHDGSVRHVKVRVLSGYQRRWGLGEIEMFGDGAVEQTDDDWYNVNDDVTGLEPGKTYHYRIVATANGTETYGEDQLFTVPTGLGAEVFTNPPSRFGNGTAILNARINPLGLRATWYVEYGETAAYGKQHNPAGCCGWQQYAGQAETPRTISTELTGLTPGKTYHYRFVAVSYTRDFSHTYITRGQDVSFVAQ